MPTKQLKVLIVDDSLTVRTNLVHMINNTSDLCVVGEAANGKQAVNMATALHPDVILMDVFMPEMGGLEATEEIMHRMPTPIVVISGSVDEKEANLAFKAINSGALTAIRKPPGPRDPGYDIEVKELINTVRAMASVQVIHRWKSEAAKPVLRPTPTVVVADPGVSPKIVAIVASTGGPSALSEIIHNLPAEFPLPVVIVQHMTGEFIPSLVTWLNSITPLNVKVADQDELPRSGTVYIAPGDKHLRITRNLRFDLNRYPDALPHIPSGDIFLESVAQAYGFQAIGMVLTGMGDDGAIGLRALFDRGSMTIAQDEETSVVYGMPRRAAELGAVRHILPLAQIPNTLTELVKAGNP
jgi:two-component system chemotaxis response regulator CheB